ncbi:MAG: penicillin acylase family protein [Myxococcota bacterium]|nr:penicillin acylase family protein [Myxococcota bacterium]
MGGWGALALLLVVAALVTFGLERGRNKAAERDALPRVSGRVSVSGLAEPVTLVREASGFPHVLAANERDAWFGLGFVHAQDRLSQMLWLVRLARGTTAEVLGPVGLPADRQARTLGLARIAEGEWERLGEPARGVLQAYAAGVNAWIRQLQDGDAGAPVAVALGGLPLETWLPADSLAVLKLHAWSLSGSVDASLVLHDLLKRLGGVESRLFFPRDSSGESLPSSDRPPLTASTPAPAWVDPLRRATGLSGASAGSTAWVLSGEYTASGLPMLGADLHVEPTVPLLVHAARVRGGDVDVAGALIPGLPLVWTGHNGRVAWGATHARAAVTDLYSERIAERETEPADHYHTGRRWRPLDVRVESIGVRGQAPEELVVRGTAHGPLLAPPVAGKDSFAVAGAGAGGRGGATLSAFLEAARAGDAGSFRDALVGVATPALAVVFADTAGAGGLQVAGWIPQRSLPSELVPVPGRAPWYDWKGPTPFEKLPRASLGPGSPFLVAADNRLPSPGARRGEWLWHPGVRAARVETLLRAAVRSGNFDVDDAEALQADVLEPSGLHIVETALAVVASEPLGREATEVAAILQGWDGMADTGSLGAAAYHAFLDALVRRLFAERLGSALFERWLALPYADPAGRVRAVFRSVDQPDAWTDRAGLAHAVVRALRDARLDLASRLGGSRRKWSWGRLHQVFFRPFVPYAGAAGVGPFEAPGSGDTIATAEYAPADPFRVRIASLFRMAADTGSLQSARFLLAPGAGEHRGHPDLVAGIPRWQRGAGSPLGFGAEPQGRDRLVLEPHR